MANKNIKLLVEMVKTLDEKLDAKSTNDDDPSRGKGHLRVSMLEVTRGKIM